jgi:hypothetical protein
MSIQSVVCVDADVNEVHAVQNGTRYRRTVRSIISVLSSEIQLPGLQYFTR